MNEARHILSEYERRSSSFQLGLEEGLQEGLQEGFRTAILTLLAARGFEVDDQTRARILACDRSEDLESLAGRAATITALGDLFA